MDKDVLNICLQETFSKRDLRAILDECERGKSLAPIYAACYISNRPLTEADIKRGQELWAELQRDKE